MIALHRALRIVVVFAAFAFSAAANSFAIKWPVRIHQEITRESLELGVELPNSQVKYFSMPAVLEIEKHNIRVDKDQGKEYTDRHFDSDNFPGGSRRLIQLRDYIVELLTHESFLEPLEVASAIEANLRVSKARVQMGEALHTLQDFYAHSNWVERSGLSTSQINSQLGVKVMSPAYPADSCYANDLLNSPLTSAFSDGLLGLCTAPDNKCAHGYGGTLPCQGINKDSWQQAEDDVFFAARSQAVIASRNFVRDTLLDVFRNHYKISAQLGAAGALQATQVAVCQFMGVPNPLTNCVTTHTVTVQKLNNANGSPTLEGLVESSGNTVTPAINCGLICQGTAIAGSTVVLTAIDTSDWKFVRWAPDGACAGSTARQCNVVVDGNKLGNAEFKFEPLPNPTSFQGEVNLTGPAGITGTQCTGTLTLVGTATVNLNQNPTLTINGTEYIQLSCYSSSGPSNVTIPLVIAGNSISGQFIGPFTCPAPCVSGQSTFNVELLRIGSGIDQILQGTIDYTNENQTPFLAITSGAVTLYEDE